MSQSICNMKCKVCIKILLIGSMIFLFGCHSQKSKAKEERIDIPDTSLIEDSSLAFRDKKLPADTFKMTPINLSVAKNIEILSAKKVMAEDNTSGQYYEKCNEWSLTIDEIKKIIIGSKPISSEMVNLTYWNMPCKMEGEINVNNVKFNYKVNAGAWSVLFNKDTAFYFAYFKKNWEKYFLKNEDIKGSLQ
jgi:hypothetical protein